MADYKLGITPVINFEGGWVKDPDDADAKTYKNISRTNWPHWSGWAIIDICKKDSKNFPKNCYSNPTLNDLVIGFYKSNFWNKIGGDGIRDQSIANLLVDSAVNEGIVPAVRRAHGIVGIAQTGVVSDDLIKKLNELV